MKNITSILLVIASIALVWSFNEIRQSKDKTERKIESVRQELAREEQMWQEKTALLEKAKKDVEKQEKQARSKIKELQTRVELLKADYEKKLSGEKYYWQEQFEKFRAQDLEQIQNQIIVFLKEAESFMNRDKYIEALKYYSKVLALEPSHEKAMEGLSRANSLISEEVGLTQIIKDLEKAVIKLKKRDSRQLQTLKKEAEEHRLRYKKLKKAAEKEKQQRFELINNRKSLEKRLSAKSKEWDQKKNSLEKLITRLEKDKKESDRLKKEVSSSIEKLKQDYENKFKELEEEAEEKIIQARQDANLKINQLNKHWEERLTGTEQEKIKAAEQIALLRIRFNAAEENAQKKILAEREAWQERFEALQSPINQQLLSRNQLAQPGTPGSVEVNLEVLDTVKKKNEQKREALRILDQAMNYIQKEDYHTAETLLRKSAKLDPQNKAISEILLKIKALSAL